MIGTDKQTADNGQGRDKSGRFSEGNPGGPGRDRGTPNRVSGLLRDDILQAYQERGGVEWLRSLPPRDFIRLLEKVMPRQVAADVRMQAEGQRGVDFAAMSDDDLERCGNAIGRKMRRIDGEVWSYEDADAALALDEVRMILDGFRPGSLGPLERECLQNAVAAMGKRLPELADLLPRAEAALAAMLTQDTGGSALRNAERKEGQK